MYVARNNIKYDSARVLETHYNYVTIEKLGYIEFYRGEGETCIAVDIDIHAPYAGSVITANILEKYDEIMRVHDTFKGDAIVYDISLGVKPIYNVTAGEQLCKDFSNIPPNKNYSSLFIEHEKGVARIDGRSGIGNLIYAHQDLSDLQPGLEINTKYVLDVWFRVHDRKVENWTIQPVDKINAYGENLLSKELFSSLKTIVSKAEVIPIQVPLLDKPKTVVDKIVDNFLEKKERVLLSELTLGKIPLTKKFTQVELDIPTKELGIYKINLMNGVLSVYSDLEDVTQEDIEREYNLKDVILFRKTRDGELSEDEYWNRMYDYRRH